MLGGWEGTDAPRLIERHVEQDTTGANGKTSIADFFNLIFFLRRAVVIFFRILVYYIHTYLYSTGNRFGQQGDVTVVCDARV